MPDEIGWNGPPCPLCGRELDAEAVSDGRAITIAESCPEHGPISLADPFASSAVTLARQTRPATRKFGTRSCKRVIEIRAAATCGAILLPRNLRSGYQDVWNTLKTDKHQPPGRPATGRITQRAASRQREVHTLARESHGAHRV